jgi:hypothetical protein
MVVNESLKEDDYEEEDLSTDEPEISRTRNGC